MTKFQAGTILTSQVMDCQVHAIGKAIRPLFADLVTNIFHLLSVTNNALLHTLLHYNYTTTIIIIIICTPCILWLHIVCAPWITVPMPYH